MRGARRCDQGRGLSPTRVTNFRGGGVFVFFSLWKSGPLPPQQTTTDWFYCVVAIDALFFVTCRDYICHQKCTSKEVLARGTKTDADSQAKCCFWNAEFLNVACLLFGYAKGVTFVRKRAHGLNQQPIWAACYLWIYTKYFCFSYILITIFQGFLVWIGSNWIRMHKRKYKNIDSLAISARFKLTPY